MESSSKSASQTHCPITPRRAETTPTTQAHHSSAAFWAAQGPTEVLLTGTEIEALNAAAYTLRGGPRPLEAITREAAGTENALEERITYMTAELASGRWVEDTAGDLAQAVERVRSSVALDHHRLILEETQLRCMPLVGGLYVHPVDRDFDRNACSSLHPGEAVRVLRQTPDRAWTYVQSAHSVGWLHGDGLGPRLSEAQWRTWTASPRLHSHSDDLHTVEGLRLRLGVSVPIEQASADPISVWVPSPDGLARAHVATDTGARVGPLPLTRAAVFTAAFELLDEPYGWGGRAGHRDCSRYLRDLFAAFGLELARHSGVQAQQGTRSVDVEGWSDAEKGALLRDAGTRGIALVYMPGHIMLYLGFDGGEHYAVSALSEWLEPCPGGPDTVVRIDKVAVSTLELGRATSRRSFIERMTKVVVFE